MGADEAGSGKQPGGQAVTPPRLAVVLGRSADADRICRVDEPDRVLRIWALLNDANNELHQVSLPPAATPRLQRQLDALTGELERSVSPALAGELRHLIPQGQATAPTADTNPCGERFQAEPLTTAAVLDAGRTFAPGRRQTAALILSPGSAEAVRRAGLAPRDVRAMGPGRLQRQEAGYELAR